MKTKKTIWIPAIVAAVVAALLVAYYYYMSSFHGNGQVPLEGGARNLPAERMNRQFGEEGMQGIFSTLGTSCFVPGGRQFLLVLVQEEVKVAVDGGAKSCEVATLCA